jgi:hypothetical protein
MKNIPPPLHKNQLNYFQNLLTLASLTLIITVWSTVFYVKHQNGMMKKYSYSEIETTSETDKESPAWKNYELVDNLVQIQLPQSLKDLECEPPNCTRISTEFVTGTKISSISSRRFSDKQQWNSILLQLEEDKVTYTKTTINNKEAIYIKTEKDEVPFLLRYGGSGIYKEGVVIKLNPEGDWLSFYIYKINPNTLKSGVINETQLEIFHQILSTFEFIE